MILRLIFTVSLCVILHGCITQNPHLYRDKLDTTEECCLNLKQLSQHQLSFSIGTYFYIGSRHKEIIEIDGNRTYAVITKLPLYEGPYSIEIQSSANGNSVMAPLVDLLDINFSALRTYNHSDFRFNRKAYKKTIFINESNANEEYLLIRCDTSSQDTHKVTDVTATTTQLGPGAYFTTASGDNTNVVESDCGGTVIVKLTPYAPQVIDRQ